MSNSLEINFHSDGAKEATGFVADWIIVEGLCGGRLNGTNGLVSTPGYPSPGISGRSDLWFFRPVRRFLISPFPKDTSCIWYLEAPADLVIEINFKNFDLGGNPASGSSCDASRGWVNVTEVREDRIWDPADTNVLLEPTCGKQTAVVVKNSLGPYVKDRLDFTSSIITRLRKVKWGQVRSIRENWAVKRLNSKRERIKRLDSSSNIRRKIILMIVEVIMVVMTSTESFNHLAIQRVTIITYFVHGESLCKKVWDSRIIYGPENKNRGSLKRWKYKTWVWWNIHRRYFNVSSFQPHHIIYTDVVPV